MINPVVPTNVTSYFVMRIHFKVLVIIVKIFRRILEN